MSLRVPYPKNVDLIVEGTEATAAFCILADFPYFDGHFPGNPIVPAVVQIAWALVGVEALRGVAMKNYRLSRFKFILPIVPGMALRASFGKVENKYSFRLYADGALCSSGTLTLSE